MISNAWSIAGPADGRARAQGLAECWDILRVHGKTFHVMAKLLGPERGDAIAALYGFARVADDLVDERPPGARPDDVRAKLHRMLAQLRCAVAGEPVEPRWLVLGETIRKYGETIGRASAPIMRGALVHIHNLEGTRARGDLERSGKR